MKTASLLLPGYSRLIAQKDNISRTVITEYLKDVHKFEKHPIKTGRLEVTQRLSHSLFQNPP